MFADDLRQFGPQSASQSASQPPSTPADARRYCCRLARRHYENFTVATRLLPRALRQHFCNVYAYCRWADDLADETGDAGQSLKLLAWWESELRDCYGGKTRHPVFVALADTIEKFEIPIEPFLDLLVAFRQDQHGRRYEQFEQLLEYCRYSANPVGRLVLYLGRCHTPDLVRWSDSICTGLQLANFWQDIARDFDSGRIYLPLADCRRFGYDEAQFSRREPNEAFRRLLAARVEQADGMLREGMPLIARVSPEVRLSVALFLHGGLAILEAIRRQDYDVWTARPTLSKMEKLRIVAGCWWRLRRGTFPRSES